LIYVIKENAPTTRSWHDAEGNGDPGCVCSAKKSRPTTKLAREFVLLDNFYVESEVSADGHEWSMGAYAPILLKNSGRSLGHNRRAKYPYPSEGNFKCSAAEGYLDRQRAAGVSYRSYGEFINNGKQATTRQIGVAALQGISTNGTRSFDMDYSTETRGPLSLRTETV